MYATQLIRACAGNLDPRYEDLMAAFSHCFSQLPPNRQTHLNAVTELAHRLMLLRRGHEFDYPIVGTDGEVERYLARLLLACNMHDFGDIPVEIPEEWIHTDETITRREAIKQGDWISSAGYGAEKFDAPIRGQMIHRAIHIALDAGEAKRAPFDLIIQQLGLTKETQERLSGAAREQCLWNTKVAFQHHEYYDGKGWPRGIELDPEDRLMDIIFADFMAGWYIDKVTRGDPPGEIKASVPATVLEAIEKRQAASAARHPRDIPMYHPRWVALAKEHLGDVDDIVDSIFPDVKARR